MEEKEIYLKDMEIQWNDHFHMRDQTWKTLQYTILFFLGVVGLELKVGVNQRVILLAYIAVCVISTLGLIVGFHHRNRQNMKFDLIKLYEEKLELTPLIKDILIKYDTGFFNNINTSTYCCSTGMSLLCFTFNGSCPLLLMFIICR